MAGAGLEYKSRAGARQEQKEGQDRSRSGGGQELRFHANISPVYLNWMKNSKLKDFAIGWFWSFGSVGQKIVAISNSMFFFGEYRIQNLMKILEVSNFHY